MVHLFFLVTRSLGGSDALGTAIHLFHRQLQLSIVGGKADSHVLTSILSTLGHLDPFQTGNNREYGFLWITDLLNSGYPEDERYWMAGIVVRLLGKQFNSNDPEHFHPACIPPLLSFLSLGERFYATESPPHPGFIALRILSSSPRYSNFCAMISPVLASVLLPTHPLQSRNLALRVFYRSIAGWFSSQMENVQKADLDKLLQAVGDPFQFPNPPSQDGRPVVAADYKLLMAAVVLIEFASSDLWRVHLRRSNFTSCEEILSTEEGRRTALRCMLDTATHSWSGFLHTPTKIIAAIRRLEELQCSNTAEVVILWAYTTGVVNAMDSDAWGLIERDTLLFYRTHGIGRLAPLKRHIVDFDGTAEVKHMRFLLVHYNGSPCRVGSARHPAPIAGGSEEFKPEYLSDLRVARVCQLRRLYHLFGYDPTTWEEAVAMGEVAEGVDVSSGWSVRAVKHTDWACDYP